MKYLTTTSVMMELLKSMAILMILIVCSVIFVSWINIDIVSKKVIGFKPKRLHQIGQNRRRKPREKVPLLLKERAHQVKKVCSDFGQLNSPPGHMKTFLWSIENQHNLLMCRTAKHGSTTWASLFVHMYNHG